MKNNNLFWGLMAIASLTLLTNCAKTEVESAEENYKKETVKVGTPFEFVAKTIRTKTQNNSSSTEWKENDAVNLFHRENGTTGSFGTNDQFTITSENLASETFTGTLTEALEDGKKYDWFALYPYNVGYTTPANDSYSASIGGTSKTQTGYGSMAHLAGTTMPMVGKAVNVAKETTPSITFSHIASVAKIVVTNNSGAPLTITSVTLTAPENIVGSFKLDFSDPDNVAISDGTYTKSNVAELKVTGGTALAEGESATFYIAVKPFDLAQDDELTIKVNTFSKTIAMPKAYSFVAGEIKTINFNYNKSFTSQPFYHRTSIAAGDKVVITGGTTGSIKVMGHYSSGSNIPSVDGTVASGCLNSTATMGIFTVAGNSTDGYTFYDPENETYLNATSSTGSSSLKGVASLDSYAYWSVAFEEGAAVITNKGKNTRNIIRLNSSGSPFNAYTSGQDPVYIFKYDSRTPVSLSFSSPSVSKTTANYEAFTGQTATATPSVSPIAYSIDSDAIGTIDPSTGAVSLNGTTGTATVTASFAGNETHMDATATYTITVNSVANPTSGSILFSCDFGSTNNLAFADYTGGTSWNNASTLSYSVSDASKVFISTGSAGNMTSGNLYFNGKNNSAGYTATIAGIKTYGATNITVFWAANNASSDLEVPGSTTSKTTSANSATNRQVFALTGEETSISLVFSNNAAANTRIDNVVVKYGNVGE